MRLITNEDFLESYTNTNVEGTQEEGESFQEFEDKMMMKTDLIFVITLPNLNHRNNIVCCPL